MIKIICVGKIKDSFNKDAILEYIKRISKYTKLEIIEIEDYNDNDLSIKKEEEQILKHIKPKEYLIALDIDGKLIDSIEFSKIINDTFNNYSTIVFIIGGSNGLTNKIKNMCNYRLSFSKLTFPHQLFRVILLEQIYRSYKIINNESYHK